MAGKYTKFENETSSPGEQNNRDTFPESETQIGVPETNQLHRDTSSSKQDVPDNNAPNAAAVDAETPPEYTPRAGGTESNGVNGTNLQDPPGYTSQFGSFPYGNIPIAPGVTSSASFSLQPVYQLAYQPQGPFPTDSEQFRVREEAQSRGISTPYELLSQELRDEIRKKVLREQCPECGKFGGFKPEWTALFFIMVALMVAAVLIGLSIVLLCVLVVMFRLGYLCGCVYSHDGGCGCMGKYRRRRCKQCGHTAGDKRLMMMTALFALLVLAEIGGILGFILHVKQSADADTKRFSTNWKNKAYGYQQNRFTSTYPRYRGNVEGFATDQYQVSANFQETSAVPTDRGDNNKPTMFAGHPHEKESRNLGSLGGQSFEVPKLHSVAPSTEAPEMTTQSLERNFRLNGMDQVWQRESEKLLSNHSTSNIHISNATTSTTTVMEQHYMMSSNTTASTKPMRWTQKRKHHAAVSPRVGISD